MRRVEIDFQLNVHPFLGYKVEDRIDLEHAFDVDIKHRAFMGDAILRVAGVDFGSNDGWRGLVEWCLSLDATLRALTSGVETYRMSEPDTDDYIEFRIRGEVLVLTSSRGEATATASLEEFSREAFRFLRQTIVWIDREYPAAKLNREALYVWNRLDHYR